MNLSANERESLERGDPVRVAENGLDCVIVRADVYERITNVVNGDSTQIEDRLAAIWSDVPESAWAKLPTDLSEHLDHYLYDARQ
jgi:hypothetical protein